MRALHFGLDVQLTCPRSEACLDAVVATQGWTDGADAQDEIFGVYFCPAVTRPGNNRHLFRLHVELAERELDGRSVLPRREGRRGRDSGSGWTA